MSFPGLPSLSGILAPCDYTCPAATQDSIGPTSDRTLSSVGQSPATHASPITPEVPWLSLKTSSISG
jgi:hypothetical protein